MQVKEHPHMTKNICVCLEQKTVHNKSFRNRKDKTIIYPGKLIRHLFLASTLRESSDLIDC